MPPPGESWCVVLPGSGSDEVFVRAAFGGPLRAAGIGLLAPAPRPGADVLDGYRAALDEALGGPGPLLVGGVSLGAHVAARWAAGVAPGRLAGLLLALPAWTGPPDAAPAAAAARASAALVRSGGTEAALAPARRGAPAWLAAELGRAWPRYGDGLADALDAGAAAPGPSARELAGLAVPVGLVALVDDPVHPLAVARRWRAVLPRAALVTTDLAAVGADPSALGRAALAAWRAARDGEAAGELP